MSKTLFGFILSLPLILCLITGCDTSTNNNSPYPIRFYGADSIKQIDSSLSYCGLELGGTFSVDSLKRNNWRYIDTYYEQYNPESNHYIGSFHTDVHSEFEDMLAPQSAKCNVYRTLCKDLIYEIDVIINRRDTTMVNAYLLKYGNNNVTKLSNDHWEWEYKNQSINLWLRENSTTVVYRDSIAIRIHEEEIDSIHKEYQKAIEIYKAGMSNRI